MYMSSFTHWHNHNCINVQSRHRTLSILVTDMSSLQKYYNEKRHPSGQSIRDSLETYRSEVASVSTTSTSQSKWQSAISSTAQTGSGTEATLMEDLKLFLKELVSALSSIDENHLKGTAPLTSTDEQEVSP